MSNTATLLYGINIPELKRIYLDSQLENEPGCEECAKLIDDLESMSIDIHVGNENECFVAVSGTEIESGEDEIDKEPIDNDLATFMASIGSWKPVLQGAIDMIKERVPAITGDDDITVSKPGIYLIST
jgi:hypothetical protein